VQDAGGHQRLEDLEQEVVRHALRLGDHVRGYGLFAAGPRHVDQGMEGVVRGAGHLHGSFLVFMNGPGGSLDQAPDIVTSRRAEG
jgi:hypothetical protein